MRLRDRIAVAVSFAVLAGCSSGGGAAPPTTVGQGAQSSSSTAPAVDGRSAEQDAVADTVPPTNEPALPAVRIEDTIDPLTDLRMYEAAHGMLPPGPDSLGRTSTAPVAADGVCAMSFRAADSGVEPYFVRSIVGCELPSEDAAVAHASEWAQWYLDSDPDLYGLSAQVVTPFTSGDWSGRSVVTAPETDGARVVRSTSMVRQVGVRVYRVFAETYMAPDSGPDIDAEATALADRQDAYLASATIDPLQPGAGIVDAAERLMLHGVFPTWDEFESIAGAEPTDSASGFGDLIDDHPRNVVESATRSVTLGEASLSISARRYELPGDAARAARWFELDCGDVAVEPVGGVTAARRCTVEEQSIAIVQHGDRTYRIVADAGLPGYAGGAAVDALALALEERLAEFGLDSGPEQAVAVDADFAGGVAVPTDILPDLSSLEPNVNYSLSSATFAADPVTGVVTVEGEYELVGLGFIDAGSFDLRLYLGAVDSDLQRRYAGAATPLEVPADRWSANDDVDSTADPDGVFYSEAFWTRRIGDVVAVVRANTGESEPYSARVTPLIQPTLDRIAAHVAGLGPLTTPAVDGPDLIVARRAAVLLGQQPSPAYFNSVRVVRATGRPVAESPGGAVADWWVQFLEIPAVEGDTIVPGPPVGQQRIVRFETDDQAEAFLQSVVGWSAATAEPIGAMGVVGWAPSSDGLRGVFATRLGRWVFVMEDAALWIPPQTFDENGDPTSRRTSRDSADGWADLIWQSGLR